MTRGRGFTLLELLVAVAVFAVMSVLAYAGLASVLDARRQTDAAAARLGEVQLAFTVLQRDLEQALNRSVRAEYGDRLRAFTAAADGDPRLEFTRTGHANPLARPRSVLLRVAYGVEDDALYRLQWPVLDRAQDTRPHKFTVLEGVDRLEVRYLDSAGRWHEVWPPLRSDTAVETGLPRAAEVTLVLADWGKVTRLFVLPRES